MKVYIIPNQTRKITGNQIRLCGYCFSTKIHEYITKTVSLLKTYKENNNVFEFILY